MKIASKRWRARSAALRDANEAAFVPFLMAGDPDLETTERLAVALAEQGADMLEIARLQQIMQGLDPTHSFDLTEELQIRFIEMLVRCARPADSAGATGAAESEAPTEAVDATMDEGADIGSV